MKINSSFITISFFLNIVINTSCNKDNNNVDINEEDIITSLTPNIELLDDFWFGYYQEDVTTNPEDARPGFLYLKIPESGEFEGELYFSFSGCETGVDVGRIRGNSVGKNLNGLWTGTVDNIAVGGNYIGNLVTDNSYEGTYTNEQGKVKIECDSEFSYYVAPNGTFLLQKTGDNNELEIEVNTEVDPISLSWKDTNNLKDDVLYDVVFIDAECLDDNLNLEECLMWSGISTTNSIIYGEGINETVPAKRLITGKTYIGSITCINIVTREVEASSNVRFVARVNSASNIPN